MLTMKNNIRYTERVSSKRTEALFLALTLVFVLLLIWHVTVSDLDIPAVGFGVFSVIFLFYSVNYRTLEICLTAEQMRLTFGVITWRIDLDNVAECHLDEIPPLMKMGGGGNTFHVYSPALPSLI